MVVLQISHVYVWLKISKTIHIRFHSNLKKYVYFAKSKKGDRHMRKIVTRIKIKYVILTMLGLLTTYKKSYLFRLISCVHYNLINGVS